jgi:hypothetical protein
MGTLSIRWMVKVLLYALVVGGLVIVNILWNPRPVQSPAVPVGPEMVQPLLTQCQSYTGDVVEVHRCDSGWAVYRASRSPQVFDADGKVLCEDRDVTDASASDCLRAVSDQVGQCRVVCAAPR